ncbi:hypothetical protein [Actinophytocola sp. NPDC049390]|uniref:hypothetical protein n=1 Tax=Actinophytocola sp. NPDC049390 TaxID=3363894 RepID=UPI00379E097E
MTSPDTMLRLLGSIREHLATHALTTPLASVTVADNLIDGEHVTVHLRTSPLADLSSALLAWVDTLTKVTVTAWRPSHGETVHLTVTGARHDATRVLVYGGVDFSDVFRDLQPGGRHSVALSVLRSWAAGSAEVAA